MNLSNILEIFYASIFVGCFFVFAGQHFLKIKIPKSIKSLFLLVSLIIFITVNYLFLDNSAKMMILYIGVLCVYKNTFRKNITQCATASLISYLLLVIGELIFISCVSLANSLGATLIIDIFKGDLIANFLICVFASLLVLLFKKPISKMVSKIKESNKFVLIFTFAIILMAICSLFYKMFFDDWHLDKHFLLNGILIICMGYVGFIIIKQHIEKSKISDEYENYVNYSKQSEKLVEEYSITQHENKNELIIIKSMVNKDNKELLEYLDEIITSKDSIQNSWIKYLRYIPFGGLKGIIHNKISEMKEQNINVFLEISKKLKKSNLKNLTIKENNQLSKIIGVFLDNAKEAALLSDKKEISVCIYLDDDKVIFEISNTYNGTIDVENIYSAGNSTKGKSRGYGLALVKTIVDENHMFKNEIKIIDDYFVQILKVSVH